MLSDKKSRSWSWTFLIFLLVFFTGIPFFKKQKPLLPFSGFKNTTAESPLNEAPFYREEVIDPAENYHMAHVASMTELPDGMLAATWYAGSSELAPDVKIYFSTQAPGAMNWNSPTVIVTRESATRELKRFIKSLGNALLFATAEGKLQLLYVTVSFGKWSGSQLNLTTSQDQGKTWEPSRRLFLSPFFNFSELVKNAPTPLVNGGWVIPIYQEFLGKFPELLWLTLQEDGSWQAAKSRIAGGCSLFQPTLTALDEQSAVAFCRDYETAQKIWSTRTSDAGKTWTPPQPTSLPNHDSGVASVRLSNGWLVVAFNDDLTTARHTLRLALSQDEGKSWQKIATVVEDPQGDFCYPYFFRAHDGLVHLLYSWQRAHIHHVVFNESWIRSVLLQNALTATP